MGGLCRVRGRVRRSLSSENGQRTVHDLREKVPCRRLGVMQDFLQPPIEPRERDETRCKACKDGRMPISTVTQGCESYHLTHLHTRKKWNLGGHQVVPVILLRLEVWEHRRQRFSGTSCYRLTRRIPQELVDSFDHLGADTPRVADVTKDPEQFPFDNLGLYRA